LTNGHLSYSSRQRNLTIKTCCPSPEWRDKLFLKRISCGQQAVERSKGVKNILVLCTLFHCKHHRLLCICGLLLVLVLASTAFAGENIAVYPYLPKGYKSIRVFDSQGRFVGRVLAEKRYWVEIDQIPVFLQKALIAVEDARF